MKLSESNRGHIAAQLEEIADAIRDDRTVGSVEIESEKDHRLVDGRWNLSDTVEHEMYLSIEAPCKRAGETVDVGEGD